MVPNLAKRLGVETTVAHGLLSRLEKEGYVKPSKSKRLVNSLVHYKCINLLIMGSVISWFHTGVLYPAVVASLSEQ
jgi:hypothetical protein